MPANQFDTPFVRSLQRHPQWRLIFFNNKQKLFVDIRTPQAQKLFEGINNEETRYPDDFSRNLIIAYILLTKGQSVERGLDCAIKAFKLNPSQAPMQEIISDARRFSKLIPRINEFCKGYLDEFEKNKDSWAKQDGYHHRIVAAVVAADYLSKIAKKQVNTKLGEDYNTKRKLYNK